MGFDVTYSGTVAGAMEGTINGIRSIAISMAGFAYGSPLHYNTGAKWLREHFLTLAELPQAPLTFLNINVPAVEYIELRGHRVVPMGQRVYQDRVESRTDPWGQTYYWQGGVAAMGSNQPGTDVGVVSEGFVSISPITLDWTNHNHLEVLSARMSKAHA